MSKLIDYIKRADKRKLVIYLLSYLLFLIYNNVFKNVCIYPFKHQFFLAICCDHVIPCAEDEQLIYILSFQAIKLITFLIFLFYLKRHPKTLFGEVFIAYFMYDLVLILSVIWDSFGIPNIYAVQMLYSSPQVLLDGYIRYLALFISGIWTCLLFIPLYKQKQLTIQFLFNRLAIIPFSVMLTIGVISLIHKIL